MGKMQMKLSCILVGTSLVLFLFGQLIYGEIKASNPTEVIYEKINALNPSWSPDGKWIAFVGDTMSGIYIDPRPSDIFIMKSDGRDIRRLAEGRIYGQPVWSRDSKRLYFFDYDQDYDANKARKMSYCDLTSNALGVATDEEAASLPDPSISYDGKMKVFVTGTPGSTGPTAIGVKYLDSGKEVLLTQPERDCELSAPKWNPDSQWVSYTSNHWRDKSYYVWVVSVDTKRAIKLTKGVSADWSPDGGSFAFIDDKNGIRFFDWGKFKQEGKSYWEYRDNYEAAALSLAATDLTAAIKKCQEYKEFISKQNCYIAVSDAFFGSTSVQRSASRQKVINTCLSDPNQYEWIACVHGEVFQTLTGTNTLTPRFHETVKADKYRIDAFCDRFVFYPGHPGAARGFYTPALQICRELCDTNKCTICK